MVRRLGNVRWFTNLDISKRHEDLILYKTYDPSEYPKYDNYDAIEVSKTTDIPMDYDGLMGVPITFLESTTQTSSRSSGAQCWQSMAEELEGPSKTEAETKVQDHHVEWTGC